MSEPDSNGSARDITAVVLAGGFGTRIRHLLPGVPKPMAPVAGRPFLDHVVHYVASFGVKRVVVSTGFLADVVSTYFARITVPGVKLACVAEPEPLGTAGGFLYAAQAVAEKPRMWLVLNGDSLVITDLGRFADAFADGDWEAAILGLRVSDAARYGTLDVGPNSDLQQFAEKRPGAGLINAGVYLLRHSVLSRFAGRARLSFETEVFPELLAQKCRILVHAVDAPFLDIGTPESLAQAEEFILTQASMASVGRLTL